MRRHVGLLAGVLVCALVAQSCASPAEDPPRAFEPPGVVYVYDDIGRLRGVIDPETQAATYRYDPVGNVVAIDRFPSDRLTVIGVTPRQADAGDELVLRGTGFAGRAGQNTVEIGGVEAEVTEARPFELTVVVPDEAESGPVTVAVDGDSAASDDDVEIGGGRAPVIDGLSASAVGVGETLTIEGSNFAADPLLNAVMVDGAAYAAVESASATELVVRLPVAVASGPVTVTTPTGRAESSDDLVVAPPPYEGRDVVVAEQAEPGEPASVAIEPSNEDQVGVVVFDAEAGQRPGVTFSRWEFGSCGLNYGLFGPGGVELVPPEAFTPERTDARCNQEFEGLPPTLPTTGTYALVLVPTAGQSGSLDVTVELEDPEPDDDQGDSAADGTNSSDEAGGGSRGVGGVDDQGDSGDADDEGAAVLALPGGLQAGHPGYPVDLASGQFVFEATDLVVDDVVPVALSRGYRPPRGFEIRSAAGAFGSGAALEFDLNLRVAPVNQTAELLLAGGGAPVVYERTTDGIDEEDAVFEHVSTPSVFRRSRIVWNGNGWDLQLRDGPTLVFHRQGPLAAVRDPSGNQIVVHREREEVTGRPGRVVAVLSSLGRSLSFGYDGEGRVAEAADHLGRTVTYGYDDQGRLAAVGYPGGVGLRYGYDAEGRMATIAGPDGALLTNEYDEDGRVVRQVLPGGSAFVFRYATTADGHVTETLVTDPAGIVRRATFDAGHWLTDTLAVGTPLEQAVAVERQPETRLTTAMIDPLGRRTAFGYDDLGRQTSVTELDGTPDALTTTFGYEADTGRVAAVTDPYDRATSFGYDSVGNLASVVDPEGAETAYDYDRRGRLVGVTDPAGGGATIDYAGAHRVTVTDPLGNTAATFLDAAGRVAVSTDPAGNTTRYGYDELDRLVSVVDPLGAATGFGYDALGNLVAVTDANANTTGFAYDALGRVVERTDPLGAVDRYGYDAVGNLVEHADRRGVVSQFSYDGFGRQTEARFGVEAGAGAGAEAGSADAESTIAYRYDELGRLVSVEDAAYGVVGFTYDELGRLVAETSPQGEVGYGYDSSARRATMALEGGPETSYDYGDDGFLAAITQAGHGPGGGGDGSGRGDVGVTVSRDELGRPERLALPNGVTMDQAYDASGYLTDTSYLTGGSDDGGGGGHGEESLGYGYDAAGRRTAVYGSLAATALPEPVAEIEYDAANRLVRWGEAELAYDAAGNLVDDGSSTFTWDARGQLVGVEGEGEEERAASATFGYDPFGRRVSKTVDGVTTSYVYDGPNVVREQVGDRSPVDYLTGLGIDEVFARVGEDGATTAYLADGLGSIVGLVDDSGGGSGGGDSGGIGTRYVYEPFGAMAGAGAGGIEDDGEASDGGEGEAAAANPFGFTGRERDETGLYFYRARYYQPETGRFISEDPLGFAAGDPNLYAYVANSPTNYTDPSGTCLASAWQLLDGSFELLDEMLANMQEGIEEIEATGHVSDENLIEGAELVREAGDNLNRFFEVCGVELLFWQMALPAIGGIAGALRATTTRLLPGAARLGPATGARLGPTAGVSSASPNTVAQFGDDVLALPRGGANLSQQRLDHIIFRHWPDTATANAGHFAPGTTGRSLTGMIDDAVRGGTFRPNTLDRPGLIFEYDIGSTIGSKAGGQATSRLRVVVDPNGNVITAFPY